MQNMNHAPVDTQPRPSLFAASALVLLASIGLWAASLAALLLNGSSVMAVNLIYYLPFMAIPVALYMRRHPGLADAMRLKPLALLPSLTVTLLALMSVYAASFLAEVWNAGWNALGLYSTSTSFIPESWAEQMLSVIGMAAIPAVCEELVFRGFAMAAWEHMGTAFAVWTTSALFALLHGNLFGLPAYLLVGATAGFVTWTLDSVYAGMLYHTVYNTACLVIPWMLRDQAAAEEAVTGSQLASLAPSLILLALMMTIMMLSLRWRARQMDIEPLPRIRRSLTAREKRIVWAMLLFLLFTLAAMTWLTATGGPV